MIVCLSTFKKTKLTSEIEKVFKHTRIDSRCDKDLREEFVVDDVNDDDVSFNVADDDDVIDAVRAANALACCRAIEKLNKNHTKSISQINSNVYRYCDDVLQRDAIDHSAHSTTKNDNEKTITIKINCFSFANNY